MSGQQSRKSATYKGYIEIRKTLLKQKVDIHAAGQWKFTPFNIAARGGNVALPGNGLGTE